MGRKCIFCGKNLTQDEKPEHIIPNALGGKLKSKDIICDSCNNSYSYLDKELAEELSPLTSLIQPKRDNGKTGRSECSIFGVPGEKLSDGSIKVNTIKIKEENGKLILNGILSHTPNSQAEKENKQYLDKILKTAIKDRNQRQASKDKLNRYIELNATDIRSPIVKATIALNNNGNLMLEMLKIITEYYAYSGYDIKYISEVVNVLRNKDTAKANRITNYYDWQDWSKCEGIYHVLCLKGDPTNKILYGIVSIYGVLDVFILLNDNYCGLAIDKTYSFDVKNSQTTMGSLLPNITKDNLNSILQKQRDQKNLQDKINHFLSQTIISPLEPKLISALQDKIFGTDEIIEETLFEKSVNKIISDTLSSNLECFNSLPNNNKKEIIDKIFKEMPELQNYKVYRDTKIKKDKILAIYYEILDKLKNIDVAANPDVFVQKFLYEINNYNYDDVFIKEWILTNQDIVSDLLKNTLCELK
ncbi:MAG: HNH endonuclease [Elusimicrobiales bacterium]|nr:HNH endonuclease [Elusimicrobiales bacterium]